MIWGAPRRRARFGAIWTACFLALTLSVGCKRKPTIQTGSEVKLHYTLTVDGQTVDSSRSGEPLSFTAGAGQIIPGLEEQLKGLKTGDHRAITVLPEKGYGPVHADAIQKVPRKNFQNAGELRVGSTVTAQSNGRMLQARVTQVDKDMITVDMNHPMAGKTLNFDIDVVDVSNGKKG
jgi:FKBP-type peptidyl-prolyl cis-trans isomerase SlyD